MWTPHFGYQLAVKSTEHRSLVIGAPHHEAVNCGTLAGNRTQARGLGILATATETTQQDPVEPKNEDLEKN